MLESIRYAWTLLLCEAASISCHRNGACDPSAIARVFSSPSGVIGRRVFGATWAYMDLTGRIVEREEAFGQGYTPTIVDRFGIWLSARQIRRFVPSFADKCIADLGAGYHAAFTRTVLDEAAGAVVVDVALADDLKVHPKVHAIEGTLPESLAGLPDRSVDVVLIVSVLEHLWEPLLALQEIHRLLRPGGVCLVNVPSWRGKRYLEFSAFRLGLSPAAEMDDHKTYYDVSDLWPVLVRAGFLPSGITCFSHKFGLNTFAACRKR